MPTRSALKRSTAVLGGIAVLAALATFVAIAWRFQRGFDWTDEAFYVAMPARFAMGDRPFVDELNVGENAGIFLWPFLKVWHALFGWTGVFAFVRVLYLGFLSGVGVALYALARACRAAAPTGIILGAACLCFIPYGCPALSYNTLATGLCAIGFFVAAKALIDDKPGVVWYRDPIVYSGFALGCASFAYPTVVVAAAAAAAAVFAFSTERLKAFLRFCGGGVAVAILMAPIFLRAGGTNIKAVMDYSFGGQPPTAGAFADKLSIAWVQFQSFNPEMWKHLSYAAIAVLLAKRWPFAMGLLLPLFPLLVRVPFTVQHAHLHYFACFGMYAPIFAVALERRRLALILCGTVWVPAVVSAFAISVSSGNGSRSAGIGMYAGTFVSALIFSLWVGELSSRWTWSFLRPVTQLAPLLFLYALEKYALDDALVYRDGTLPQLTTKMTSGPYKGLYTTPDRKRWLGKLEADVKNHHAGARTSFWYDFPAGYLYADLPPHLPCVWGFSYMTHRIEIEARWLRERSVTGEFVFRVGAGFSPARDGLDAALNERATQVGVGEGYTIWEVK
jgi:hypothetical protein